MCQKDKNRPAAYSGTVAHLLPGREQLVSVPGVGTVKTKDRSGAARPGARVTVVQTGGGEWRIV